MTGAGTDDKLPGAYGVRGHVGRLVWVMGLCEGGVVWNLKI